MNILAAFGEIKVVFQLSPYLVNCIYFYYKPNPQDHWPDNNIFYKSCFHQKKLIRIFSMYITPGELKQNNALFTENFKFKA